jgi:hypothetical protein
MVEADLLEWGNGARYRVRTCDPYRVKVSEKYAFIGIFTFIFGGAKFGATICCFQRPNHQITVGILS